MFYSARLKLTTWYVLTIMVISSLFSAVAYRALTQELDRGMRIQAFRMDPAPGFGWQPRHDVWHIFEEDLNGLPMIKVDLEMLNEAKSRILWRIILANSMTLIVSALISYFVAGRTLDPIETMVEDQKRFIADASHELRTPITTMRSEIEVAMREKRITHTEVKKLLESNLEEVNKLQSLTNYLLSMNRLESQTDGLSKETLDLSEVTKATVQKLKRLFENKGLRVETDFSSVRVLGNRMALDELAKILIDNAIKYSQQEGEVKISTKQKGRQAILIVQDSGIGMKSSELPYIFNRFYRADSSRSKHKVDGFGLGLAIAKKIVDWHGGEIAVESTPGKGSKFEVILPMK